MPPLPAWVQSTDTLRAVAYDLSAGVWRTLTAPEIATGGEALIARIEPDGDTVRMWEAIETYMARKQPLIIVAGADYGQGSSRDWAA